MFPCEIGNMMDELPTDVNVPFIGKQPTEEVMKLPVVDWNSGFAVYEGTRVKPHGS